MQTASPLHQRIPNHGGQTVQVFTEKSAHKWTCAVQTVLFKVQLYLFSGGKSTQKKGSFVCDFQIFFTINTFEIRNKHRFSCTDC